MKNFNKGQFNITLLGAMEVVSFVIAPVVAYFSAQAATKEEIAQVSERTARLETFVPTIDRRLENIEKALKITSQ